MPTKLNQTQPTQSASDCSCAKQYGPIELLVAIDNDANYRRLTDLKKREALRAVANLRSEMLDDFESFFSESSNIWPLLRSRLLTVLGTHGFEQTLQRIFDRPYVQGMPREKGRS